MLDLCAMFLFLAMIDTNGFSLGRLAGITVSVNSVYLSDYSQHVVWHLNYTTKTLSKLAGENGTSGSSASLFKNPAGCVIDENGNVYVADYGNHAIRKVIFMHISIH